MVKLFSKKIFKNIELFIRVQFRANWGLADGGIRPICLNCLNCPYQPPGGPEVWHVRGKSSDKIIPPGLVCVSKAAIYTLGKTSRKKMLLSGIARKGVGVRRPLPEFLALFYHVLVPKIA